MNQKVAVICNYKLIKERVGGMDFFFWAFDRECKVRGYTIDWFFPNEAIFGYYGSMNIIVSGSRPEIEFINYCDSSNQSYSHIFTHFLELCTSFYRDAKRYSPIIIAVVHNPRPLGGFSLSKRIKKLIKGRLYGSFVNIYICVSKVTQKEFVEDYGKYLYNRTEVILNGIDTDAIIQKQSYESQSKFVLAANLRKEKGIQDFIEALALIKSTLHPQVIFHIYGEGTYEEALKALAVEKGLDQIINFKGSVNFLPKLYHQYDYLIHPSHAETYCFTVVESLHAGLPVITTYNHGNVLGLVENNVNGYLYKAGDISHLATILNEIISGNNKIGSFNCDQRLNELTIEKSVEKYCKLVENKSRTK